MSQPKINLNNIRIASPCSQNWEEMVGDERKRFCAQCQLHVYNFSAMTQAEVESLLMKAEGRVCGRIFRRADGTILTQDCPVGLRAVRRRVGRMVTAAFSAVVSLFGGMAYAQQVQNEPKPDIQRSIRRYDQPAIQGTVYDQARAVIAGAKVSALNQATKKVITTQSDLAGRFRFTDLPVGEYDIAIESPGFTKFAVAQVRLTDEEAITFDTTLKVDANELIGVVVDPAPQIVPLNNTVLPTTLIRKDRPRQ